ncbi:hypothetical protein, partial [Parashewanella curva]|uniref:hypothetical protein n=1 Tax=Parashewanella curva TaxID=2338552 RepID=UPI001A9D97BD
MKLKRVTTKVINSALLLFPHNLQAKSKFCRLSQSRFLESQTLLMSSFCLACRSKQNLNPV